MDQHDQVAAHGSGSTSRNIAPDEKVADGAMNREKLLEATYNDCRNIWRTAVFMALEEPGFDDDFPPAEPDESSVRATAEIYLAKLEIHPSDSPAAQAAKTALAARFIAHDLPATFIGDLRRERDALEGARGTAPS